MATVDANVSSLYQQVHTIGCTAVMHYTKLHLHYSTGWFTLRVIGHLAISLH